MAGFTRGEKRKLIAIADRVPLEFSPTKARKRLLEIPVWTGIPRTKRRSALRFVLSEHRKNREMAGFLMRRLGKRRNPVQRKRFRGTPRRKFRGMLRKRSWRRGIR